ncbi:uncharacterized protein LOC143895672 [Temnothorax americanus]|uniref:uncharacterized protein LOC143895672 n=1 Tax=Temnothorax americanus TaxID=1964332 RepID=UPI0040694A42
MASPRSPDASPSFKKQQYSSASESASSSSRSPDASLSFKKQQYSSASESASSSSRSPDASLPFKKQQYSSASESASSSSPASESASSSSRSPDASLPFKKQQYSSASESASSSSPASESASSSSRSPDASLPFKKQQYSSASESAYSSSSRSPDNAGPPFKKQRTWKVMPSKLQHPSFLNELQICVNSIPNKIPSQLESNFEKEEEERQEFVTNLQEVESCVVPNELLEEAVHDFDNSNDDNSHLSSIVSLVVSSENGSNLSTSSDVDTWNDSSSDTLSENNSDDDILQPDESPFLYDGSHSTVHEAVLDIIQDNFNNNETKKSLKDHLQTFLKHIPKPNHMPKSVHLLLKFVTSLAPSLTETAYPYCSKCHLFLRMEGNCEVCECAERKYFYGFNVEKQIKFLFEHRNLGRVINEYKSMIQTCPSRNIRDICNSSEYKRVHINDQCTVTLMFNTDGVQIGNSKASLWPVQCIICEVPPHLRTTYMVVCAVWCDVQKPPMSTLLRPFVDTLKRLELDCVEWYDKVNRQHVKCKIIAPVACADGPARADIQNITAPTSKYACNYCEQRSVTVSLTLQEQQARLAGDKKIRRRRAVVFREDSAKLRENNRMKSQARKACEGLSVKGVKGPSTVARIPRLDMSTFLVAEYMHTVGLCVVKRFLNLWLYEPGPWNISANEYAIDKLLEDIKPPDTVGRLPMGVSDISHWKASIFRMWLLCYSLPIVSEFLPNIYVQHWCLFVQAIYLLLKEEISESEIDMAEIMIKMFVRDIGILYRLKDYTISVHQLLHLPLCVRRWGPLWATSAFIFENYNGILKKLIHGTKKQK